MRGCITDDFTLSGGRILGIRGPIPGIRKAAESGLFRDDFAGLKRGYDPSGAMTELQAVIDEGTNAPPTLNAGQLWKLPMPVVRATQPAPSLPWAVVGFWSLSWGAQLPANVRGTATMYAEPTAGQESPPRLRPVSRWTVSGLTARMYWANALTWPVAQTMNADEASASLYLNAHVANDTLSLWGLEHFRLAFNGFVVPLDDDIKRARTIAEALAAATGDTIQAALDAASATTVRAVVDEWSTP